MILVYANIQKGKQIRILTKQTIILYIMLIL